MGQRLEVGFQTFTCLMVKADSDLAGSTPERIANLEEELRQRLSQIPGVLSARLSLNTPMEGSNWGEPASIAGHPPPPGSEQSSPAR